MQREIADHQVKATLGEGQELFIADHTMGQPAAGRTKREVGLDQSLDTTMPGNQVSKKTVTGANLDRQGKRVRHVIKSVDETLTDLAEQKVVIGKAGCCAFPVTANRRAIEDLGRSIHEELYCQGVGGPATAVLNFPAKRRRIGG